MAKKKSTEFNRILLFGIAAVVLVIIGYYVSKQLPNSSAAGLMPSGNPAPALDSPAPDISTSGVTVSLDPTSPKSMIVLAGTQNNEVAKFRLRAVNEAFTVQKLTLVVPDTTDQGMTVDGWDSVKLLTIQYPNKMGQLVTKNAVLSSSSTKFTNLDLYVPKNGSATMTVKVDFYEIIAESADFGDRIKIGFASGAILGDFYAVGMDTGKIDQSAAPTKAPVYAAEHVLYKSKLTVTKDTSGMSSVLVPGATNTLYKFKISADANGSVAIKRLTFGITVSDNGTTSSNVDLGGFTIIRDVVDITTSALIAGTPGVADNTSQVARVSMEVKGINDIEGNSGTTWVHVMFGDTPTTGEQVIPAGATVMWQLMAEAGTGYLGADDDSIVTELVGDTVLPKINSYYLHDLDVTTAQFALVLGNLVGSIGDNASKFIWSDLSQLIHLSDVKDNTGVPGNSASSKDWTNSALIKNFPLGAWSLVA